VRYPYRDFSLFLLQQLTFAGPRYYASSVLSLPLDAHSFHALLLCPWFGAGLLTAGARRRRSWPGARIYALVRFREASRRAPAPLRAPWLTWAAAEFGPPEHPPCPTDGLPRSRRLAACAFLSLEPAYGRPRRALAGPGAVFFASRRSRSLVHWRSLSAHRVVAGPAGL